MAELALADAIRQLRREISTAALTAEGDPLKFALGEIELELQVELVAAGGGKAEFKWVIFSAGVDAKTQRTSTHRVLLKLTPELGGKPVKVTDQRRGRRG